MGRGTSLHSHRKIIRRQSIGRHTVGVEWIDTTIRLNETVTTENRWVPKTPGKPRCVCAFPSHFIVWPCVFFVYRRIHCASWGFTYQINKRKNGVLRKKADVSNDIRHRGVVPSATMRSIKRSIRFRFDARIWWRIWRAPDRRAFIYCWVALSRFVLWSAASAQCTRSLFAKCTKCVAM